MVLRSFCGATIKYLPRDKAHDQGQSFYQTLVGHAYAPDQVDPISIIDKRSKAALDQARTEITPLISTWTSSGPEEADWSKIRGVHFREALQGRNEQMSRLKAVDHVTDLPHFEEIVRQSILRLLCLY